MVPELTYDPTVNRVTLTLNGDNGWLLWTFRPDGAPAEPHLITRNEVGDAISDPQLSNRNVLIQYFERCLIRVGYSLTAEIGPAPEDFIASWELAPGRN